MNCLSGCPECKAGHLVAGRGPGTGSQPNQRPARGRPEDGPGQANRRSEGGVHGIEPVGPGRHVFRPGSAILSLRDTHRPPGSRRTLRRPHPGRVPEDLEPHVGAPPNDRGFRAAPSQSLLLPPAGPDDAVRPRADGCVRRGTGSRPHRCRPSLPRRLAGALAHSAGNGGGAPWREGSRGPSAESFAPRTLREVHGSWPMQGSGCGFGGVGAGKRRVLWRCRPSTLMTRAGGRVFVKGVGAP